MSSDADTRVVLVTGANKGIGLEAVRYLSEQLPRATILLGSRSLANAEAALTKLRAAPPPSTSSPSPAYSNIHPLVIDVTDRASIASAVSEVQRRFGRLDVLINNSGISNVDGDTMHRDVMAVNVYGVRDTVEAFLPVLSPHATVVTVSSTVGAWATAESSTELQQTLTNPSSLSFDTIDRLAQAYTAAPNASWPAPKRTFGAYAVSKALVSAYTRLVAHQHPELRVVVVCPGYCATDLNHHRGQRPAALGGQSVAWPVLHPFESGKFYQDGKEVSFSMHPPPGQFDSE